jgi:D-alanyl-lipoteichoic acid acyltransferase DltB (MBOAT superfamily)
MLFHTLTFAVFLAALLAVLTAVRHDGARKLILLGASYIFYGWSHPIYLVPLLITTTVDYAVGLMLQDEERATRRRALLIMSLTANLALLAYFKYFNFFVANAADLAQRLGFDFSPALAQLILPIGISFYTFHSMSYTIDVYRRQIPTCRSPLDFGLFITFFPVLVAGPILRAKQFLPQLRNRIHLTLTPSIVFLIIRGLAKKVLIADNLAPFVDAIFADVRRWPSLAIWCATLAFSIQIYCDFSGYSDIARGLGRILGFEIPLNFDRPYFSRNPSEFWRRWHISLSSWLRDYLYIPLGGSRLEPWKTYRNLMITMLLGGLWHGASWNFVLWGGMHGALLSIHRAWREQRSNAAKSHVGTILSWAALQYCVLVTWITFRVTDTRLMLVALRKFIVFDFDFAIFNIGLGSTFFVSTMLIVAAFLALHTWSYFRGDLDRRLSELSLPATAAASVAIGVAFFLLWPMAERPFIYFQF